jgi:dihydroorotate dehydrogenase (fumarate)
VKLSPYYSAVANFAADVLDAGASGLVMFNRLYQPDLDLDSMDVISKVELSTSSELRLPLRWIAIVRAQLGEKVGLAATSGVHTAEDVVKAIAVGANVAMMTSAILRHGPSYVNAVETALRSWLAEHEYASIDQLRSSVNQANAKDASAFERANYINTLHSWRE